MNNAAEYSEIHELLNLENSEKVGNDDIFCSTCFSTCEEEGCEYQDSETSDTLREIRRLRLEQESGMDLNSRFIRCRYCSACKDSD